MPSFVHDVPLDLFRRNPDLLMHLLRKVLRDTQGITLSPRLRLEVSDAHCKKLISLERRADLVLLLRQGKRKALVIVVEVQRNPKRGKHRSWPLYNAILHDLHNCQIALVVLAPNARTARWARRPIHTVQLGSPFVPIVLGPEEVPQVTTVEEASASLEMALLSTVMYGHEPGGAQVALAAYQASQRLSDKDYAAYLMDVILGVLSKENQQAVKEKMIPLSILKRTRGPLAMELLSQGKAEGKVEGKAEGAQKAILTVLSTRKIPVNAKIRARIRACTDLSLLDRWIARAVVADSASEVVTDD